MAKQSWDELRYHILEVLKEYRSEFDKSDDRFKDIEKAIQLLEEQNVNQKWINRIIVASSSLGGGMGGSVLLDMIKKVIG